MLFSDASPGKTAAQDSTLGDYLSDRERDYIVRTLESQSGQIQETARLPGISRKKPGGKNAETGYLARRNRWLGRVNTP